MTTITLEVPDELAQRLSLERDRLPRVLTWALQRLPPRPSVHPIASAPPPQAFTEMYEYVHDIMARLKTQTNPGSPN